MNPSITARNSASPEKHTPVRPIGAVIPLWRAAETHGLNPTPARCATSADGTAVPVGGTAR